MPSKIYKVSDIKINSSLSNRCFKREHPVFDVYLDIDKVSNAMIDFGLNNGISPEVNGRLNQIYYYLKNMNLDDVHIAAIMGNIRQESGYNVDPWSNTERLLNKEYESNKYLDQHTGEEIITFDMSRASDEQYKAESKKKLLESHAVPLYGGIGLIQWTGGIWDEESKKWIPAKSGADRKANFLNWCNSKNLEWYEMDTQLEYIFKEYNSWSLKSDFESINNVNDAAKFFCDYYEQPYDDTAPLRMEYASEFLNIFNNNLTS